MDAKVDETQAAVLTVGVLVSVLVLVIFVPVLILILVSVLVIVVDGVIASKQNIVV